MPRGGRADPSTELSVHDRDGQDHRRDRMNLRRGQVRLVSAWHRPAPWRFTPHSEKPAARREAYESSQDFLPCRGVCRFMTYLGLHDRL